MTIPIKQSLALLPALVLALGASVANAAQDYSVTITNLTKGQTFTPFLVATHSANASVFQAGAPASEELAILAEGGDIAPLEGVLLASSEVYDTNTNGALLGPGESVTIVVSGGGRFDRLSLAAMLIPTNDNFVALNSVALPARSGSFTAVAYDAGSEFNDELCASIPGPFCGGEGYSPAGGEGFVFVANGIHGIGDLASDQFDWHNPVARIDVQRN